MQTRDNQTRSEADRKWMLKAVELARRAEGFVEPNPMVGCVLVVDDQVVSTGYHQKFGAAHAEINALHGVAPDLLRKSTIYVTLEPCSTHGKTPPCVDALIAAVPRRICVGTLDPNPVNHGNGVQQLLDAGIETIIDVAKAECEELIAPFKKVVTRGQPFVIAKWAMTLDGKIASSQGHSKWISNDLALKVVHQIRGRMDGIIVGAQTALADNPLLTARPPGTRIPTRIVVDSKARLKLTSKLVQTLDQAPTMVVCHPDYAEAAKRLEDAGCMIEFIESRSPAIRIEELLKRLGQWKMTNVFVEGGGALLGSFFDCQQINEVHIFVAPKLVGGASAPSPIAGNGLPTMDESVHLSHPQWQMLGDNYYVHSRIQYR